MKNINTIKMPNARKSDIFHTGNQADARIRVNFNTGEIGNARIIGIFKMDEMGDGGVRSFAPCSSPNPLTHPPSADFPQPIWYIRPYLPL